jgi:hypothetical protein
MDERAREAFKPAANFVGQSVEFVWAAVQRALAEDTRGMRPGANEKPRAGSGGGVRVYPTEDNAALAVTAEEAASPAPKVVDWIEARKNGVEAPEFIAKNFAAELEKGDMHLGLLSRYTHLRRDLYAFKRHHELPDWLANLPTKSGWIKRQVTERALLPDSPTGPTADEVRAYNRDAKRIARARQRPSPRL